MGTCALVGAVDFNAAHFKAMDAAGAFDFVIAVDAGFASLEAIGREADMAIGDFDSLGYVPRCRRVSRHPVKKDKSDMELAMEKAVFWDNQELFVYGALAKRLDHTIANLQLFARYSERGIYVTGVGARSTSSIRLRRARLPPRRRPPPCDACRLFGDRAADLSLCRIIRLASLHNRGARMRRHAARRAERKRAFASTRDLMWIMPTKGVG